MSEQIWTVQWDYWSGSPIVSKSRQAAGEQGTSRCGVQERKVDQVIRGGDEANGSGAGRSRGSGPKETARMFRMMREDNLAGSWRGEGAYGGSRTRDEDRDTVCGTLHANRQQLTDKFFILDRL